MCEYYLYLDNHKIQRKDPQVSQFRTSGAVSAGLSHMTITMCFDKWFVGICQHVTY